MSKNERFCMHCGASNSTSSGRCFSCGSSLRITLPLDKELEQKGILLRERYLLLELIGEGGYSTVYRAQDLEEKQTVALKAISLRDLKSQEQIEATDTFNREVHFLSHLQHRNLPRVYEHFSEQECWYLVMEFINGDTLEKRLDMLKGQPLPSHEMLEIGLVLCTVLAYLHSQEPKIIFRDLKPGNIMQTQSGQLYLIDFGIARRHKPGKAHDTIPFGSPGYAAPEQYGRAQTGPSADIYSLGAILHQLCTGIDPAEQPFRFIPLPQPELQPLSQLLLRMVDVDASKRPQKIEEVQEELTQIEMTLRMERGLRGQITPPKAPPSLSYVPPSPTPALWNALQQHSSVTAIYTSQGQIQMVQQQNQYYQGPSTANSPTRNNYAIASAIFCVCSIILPVFSCAFTPLILSSWAGFALLWFPLICLSPSLGGIIFGVKGKRQARQNPMLMGTLKSAHNSMVISSIFFAIYLTIFFFILYNNHFFLPF